MSDALIFERVSGDTGPDISRSLSGTGSLTGVSTVKAYVYRDRMPTASINGVVSNPAGRTITVDIGAWLPTARNGDWKVKYRVTFTNADKQTWESGRPDVIRVSKNPYPTP